MAILAAYAVFSVLILLGFRLVVSARWQRRSIQDLLAKTSLDCRQLRDLERAMKQAFEESGIPKLLLAAADLFTVLGLLGAILVWIYLPPWYLSLGAAVALILLITILFYQVLEFAGPWWGFPADYIRSRLDGEASHDWDGCQCRVCRTPRNGGHRWDESCRCAICGEVRHQWKDGQCARCGEKRIEAQLKEAHPQGENAEARTLPIPLAASRPVGDLDAQRFAGRPSP